MNKQTIVVVLAVISLCLMAGVAEGMSSNVTKVKNFTVEPKSTLTVYDLQPSVDASYLQSTYNPQ